MPNLQIARFVLGLAWIYQGLVPKLLFLAPTEQALWQSLNPDDATIRILIYLAGFLEVVFGLIIILFYRSPRVHYLNLLALAGLLLATCVFEPHFLNDAFNPVTTNIPMMALSLIAIGELKRLRRYQQLLWQAPAAALCYKVTNPDSTHAGRGGVTFCHRPTQRELKSLVGFDLYFYPGLPGLILVYRVLSCKVDQFLGAAKPTEHRIPELGVLLAPCADMPARARKNNCVRCDDSARATVSAQLSSQPGPDQ